VIEESLLVGHENFGGVLAGGIEAWGRAGLPLRETRSIDGAEARSLLNNGATPLDVREPSEFASGHLGQAVNVPLGSIAKSLNVIPQGDPIIAYCGHGERSTTAISLLERQGIDAANLEGGFQT
jgi:rhodanese-related sulfurtransferase